MRDPAPVTCNDCKRAVFEDYGYSNYTVEGTTFMCSLAKHPRGSFDRFYGEDENLKFAAECPSFERGDAIQLDCDGEAYDALTDEERAIVDAAHAALTPPEQS